MESGIYDTPESDLKLTQTRELSRLEKLEQSRKDMQEASAIEYLNLVWGIRLVVDALFCIAAVYVIYVYFSTDLLPDLILGVITLVFFGLEIMCILAYFKRRSWCVIPLYIFSSISLLNVPFGAILSIIHFLNMHKVQFERD